jgi:hypothetical protein
MVIAMIAMRMMELTLIEVIDMVAMRDCLVSTILMPTCASGWSTVSGILTTYSNDVLIVVTPMRRMQMSLMKIINVSLVLDSRVTAVLIMDMLVLWMSSMGCHIVLLSNESENIVPNQTSPRININTFSNTMQHCDERGLGAMWGSLKTT